MRNESQNPHFYPILGPRNLAWPEEMINNKGCLNWDCLNDASLPDIFIDFLTSEIPLITDGTDELYKGYHQQYILALGQSSSAMKKKLPFFRWLAAQSRDVNAKFFEHHLFLKILEQRTIQLQAKIESLKTDLEIETMESKEAIIVGSLMTFGVMGLIEYLA